MNGAGCPFASDYWVVLLEMQAIVFVSLWEILKSAIMFFNTFNPIAYAFISIATKRNRRSKKKINEEIKSYFWNNKHNTSWSKWALTLFESRKSDVTSMIKLIEKNKHMPYDAVRCSASQCSAMQKKKQQQIQITDGNLKWRNSKLRSIRRYVLW